MGVVVDGIRDRFKWRQVVAPRPWLPEAIGQELIGYYGGRTLRQGQWGQYEVVLVHVPLDGCYTLSGTRIIQLLDASMCALGHPIRIVWQGTKPTSRNYDMKMYDVMVAEGEAIPAEALPQVQ